MFKKSIVLLGAIVLFMQSCGAPDPDLEVELEDQQFAIPLINSRLDVSTVTENTEGTSIEIASDGALTVLYKGDVVEQAATDIFMPLDTNLSIPIIDNFPFPLPVSEEGDIVNRAIFATTNIWFTYNNTTDEDLTITIDFLQFTKNGEMYSVTFDAPANMERISPMFSLEDAEVITLENNIIFDVTAINSDGVEVSPGLPFMDFDVFDLKFIEGKFNERVFDIDGSFIVVGIFDNWISGNVSFADPKLSVDVDNGFGLPVESVFNNITIRTTEDVDLEIQSDLIVDGVIFDYPSLDEVGLTKKTVFDFNKDNSNIVDLFGQRATKVTYDIDALVNPGNPDLVGFFDQSSFFRINVAVEVPLEGTVNDFVLEGDTELDVSDLEDVKEAAFKVIFENGFPIDMYSQAYFEDDAGTILDSLFDTGVFLIEAAPIGADLKVTQDKITTVELPFEEERLDKIRLATKLRIRSRFDTPDSINEDVYIYNEYGMGIKMGAVLTLK